MLAPRHRRSGRGSLDLNVQRVGLWHDLELWHLRKRLRLLRLYDVKVMAWWSFCGYGIVLFVGLAVRTTLCEIVSVG